MLVAERTDSIFDRKEPEKRWSKSLTLRKVASSVVGSTPHNERSHCVFSTVWRAGLKRAILAGMAYEYRVTEAEDGTFPVELWNSKGGREQLVYKTRGFQTRQLAEAWIVPVEVQSGGPPQPRARVTYLKPRRSRVVMVSKPNPHPPPALPES